MSDICANVFMLLCDTDSSVSSKIISIVHLEITSINNSKMIYECQNVNK